MFSTSRLVSSTSHDDAVDDSAITEQRKFAGSSITDFNFEDNMQYKEDLNNLSGIINEVITTV